ncbi:unnamed protein product [Albugo candida]|uniref:Uncharacterized protein n=1 Tax=Albugo candida TaxID=65357 RepID=A0A024FWC2_9STRA|nr:unnamed protein product [Albugo candida]|eukprot:CCI11415.1 unnamed protein product [Albugo candida]
MPHLLSDLADKNGFPSDFFSVIFRITESCSCGSGLLYRHESPFSIDVVLQSSIPIRTLLCREYSNERCSLAYCWRGRVSILSLLVYLSFVNQATSTLSNDDRRGRWHQMTLIPKEDRLCQLSNFVAMRSGLDLSFFLTDL